MTLSIIGFPRIGKNRELKFATEKYFKQEISEVDLVTIARKIRLDNWRLQKDNQIEFPISNDFSFYDQILDTAFFLNAIPQRYKDLKLTPLDTYFALARGFQDSTHDVKALPMKKWFNTNYHYLVPELNSPESIHINYQKIVTEWQEAQENGILTKPVIIGPYTFLKLADYTGTATKNDFVDAFSDVYIALLEQLNALNVPWLQIDEPALVLDQSKEDITLFTSLYHSILKQKNNVKIQIQIQTYFGDIRDSYATVVSLLFDSIGLDFVEGAQT